MSDAKEAWNRVKELWSWTRSHPKEDRTEIEQDIIAAYKTVLRRWAVRVFLLFLLTGLVKLFWQIWGRIFDILLNMIGL